MLPAIHLNCAVVVFTVISVVIKISLALVPSRLIEPFELRKRSLDPSSFPVVCQVICFPIIDVWNQCDTTAPCLCSAANGNSLVNCVDCIVSLTPTPSVIEEGQTELNQFNATCAAYNLPHYTVSVSPESASATSTGAATSASLLPTGAALSAGFPFSMSLSLDSIQSVAPTGLVGGLGGVPTRQTSAAIGSSESNIKLVGMVVIVGLMVGVVGVWVANSCEG